MPTLEMPAKATDASRKFVAKLKAWRHRYGHTQREAAKLLVVHHISLARWESGDRTPSALTIRALLPYLKK